MSEHREMQLYNEQSESASIGGLLLKKAVLQRAIQLNMKPEWFFTDVHQRLVLVIMALYDDKKPVDHVSVCNRAQEIKQRDLVMIVERCLESCTTVAHSEYHLGIVGSYYKKRLLHATMMDHSEELSTEKSAEEIASSLASETMHIAGVDEATTPAEIQANIKKRYTEANNSGKVGVPSRWLTLQRKISSYRYGKICLFAARPSVGKTTMALNEARFQCEQGYKVGYIGLDTDVEETYEVMAADKAGINLFHMYNGDLNDEELRRFDKALAEVIALPFYAISKSMDIRQICAWVSTLKADKDLDLIYVDFIQVIQPTPGLKISPRERVTQHSNEFFWLAKKHNIAVNLLAQINRTGEAPPGLRPEEYHKFRPKLHHLKESGSLEEDAFQALLLSYADPYAADNTRTNMCIDVAKNKKGPRGTFNLTFKKDLQRMEDVNEPAERQAQRPPF